MKLLRYGPAGQEKPGLLDSAGQIRDLASVVGDIAGDVLSPQGLERHLRLEIGSLPVASGRPASGPVWPASASSSASA